MPEFRPIATVHDLSLQDVFDVSAGAAAARASEPAPGSDKSRGYHQGYLIGLISSQRAKPTPEYHQLQAELEDFQATWH